MSKSKNKQKKKKKVNSNIVNKKKAHDRKLDALQKLSEIGLELSDNMYAIGIIFDNLTISHLTYSGLNSINSICEQYIGLDLYVFAEQLVRPCVQPKCSVGDIKDLFGWKNPLITTNINTCMYALNTSSEHIYHYAFDMEFIDNYDLEWPTIKKAFCDPRIKVFVRHSDHKYLLENEFGINILGIVEDFDLLSMLKLIMKDIKNDQQISNAV